MILLSVSELKTDALSLPHSPALTELLAGEVDLALGFHALGEVEHPELDIINWCEDRYVVISHARRSRLTLKDDLAARHLVVTPWNEKQGVLDLELERPGYSRQIAIKTPSMLSAPFIIAESDLLMAIPRFAAERVIPPTGIKIFELPLDVPPLTSIFIRIAEAANAGQPTG